MARVRQTSSQPRGDVDDADDRDRGALHGYASGDVVNYELRSFAGMIQLIDMSRSRGSRFLQRVFSPTLMPLPGESVAMLVSKELRKLGTTTPTTRSGTVYEGQGAAHDVVPTNVKKRATLVGFSETTRREVYELMVGAAARRTLAMRHGGRR